jgi:outer membrane receptor for ferrienterochelin and colicin
LGWETKRNEKEAQWRWDLTYHGIGKQRLVETSRDIKGSYSQSYGIWNSQITRAFQTNFEIYAGMENFGNNRQINPIIGVENPFGADFDSSQVYAPIFGRMIYAGLRWNL